MGYSSISSMGRSGVGGEFFSDKFANSMQWQSTSETSLYQSGSRAHTRAHAGSSCILTVKYAFFYFSCIAPFLQIFHSANVTFFCWISLHITMEVACGLHPFMERRVSDRYSKSILNCCQMIGFHVAHCCQTQISYLIIIWGQIWRCLEVKIDIRGHNKDGLWECNLKTVKYLPEDHLGWISCTFLGLKVETLED